MRFRLFTVAIVATGILTATGFAMANGGGRSHGLLARCLGLNCTRSGGNVVPQASAPVESVPGPNQLAGQSRAGFYEFGKGTSLGTRAVAYVVPYGQADRMPADVEDLPAVQAIDQPSGQPTDFDLGTVVIFGPDVSLSVPAQELGSRARNGAVAHISAQDQYRCEDRYFCLYSTRRFAGARIQFGPLFTGTGWHRLSDYAWNDKSYSMRNRRDYDSLLDSEWPPRRTYWTSYCADSHSSDDWLVDNPISYHASAFANVPDDIHC
jgi:hypothetical protein